VRLMRGTEPESTTVTSPGPVRTIGVGSAMCGCALTTAHTATAYVTFIAYMADPAGPWDQETLAHSNFAAGLAVALSTATTGLTWVFTKAEWLCRWWYAIPTVLTGAALLRLTLMAPTL